MYIFAVGIKETRCWEEGMAEEMWPVFVSQTPEHYEEPCTYAYKQLCSLSNG